ncbi:NACHT domain-containing NTPase, partial [Nostoc sp. CHAB 5715]|uniref:NACHT domain-containing protein n=1 Tax=Nostoc sp. CHAB 5715 TaxID=2780400 RepID=UPI0027962822
NEAVFSKSGKFLTDMQEQLLKESWHNTTYEEIANKYNYSPQYVKNAGQELWQILRQALEDNTVNKSNFHSALGRYRRNLHKVAENSISSNQIVNPTCISETEIKDLVKKARQKIKSYLQERCGKVKVLDMEQPIGLNDIYTNVNILEKIVGRRGLSLEELQQNLKSLKLDEFDRFGLCKVTEARIPGIEAVKRHSKLMVLGKPGAGKTTFLKYLAIQCIAGEFKQDYIPLFIPLKEFAETENRLKLQDYIIKQIINRTINDIQITEIIKSGKFLILLDGLDEVREEDSSWVINQIKVFSEQYYHNNFVITCRIAAREYTFEQFTEVEVADFDHQQIEIFINKWFQQKNDLEASKRFQRQLEINKPIKELANNPLLLTLLCLEFADSGDFPSDRAELYNRAIHTLLRKWDAKRGIVRDRGDDIYKKLSVKHKEDLLSQVAWTTFERNEYFFKQRDIQQYIENYIRNLPQVKTDLEALRIDSEMVLKSIEAQHGLLVERARSIYSFSHLTFQEFFTAREIVYSSNTDNLCTTLVNHISEKRWQEVFLLTVAMLKNADKLLQLMKYNIDALLAADDKLQKFLTWVEEKSCSIEASYKSAAVRAFYVALGRSLDRVRALDLDLALDLVLALALDRSLDLAIDRALNLNFAPNLDRALAKAPDGAIIRSLVRVRALDGVLGRAYSPQLQQLLQQLKEQIPNPKDEKLFVQWWQENGQAWSEKLRSAMIEHRNIGHNWQFSDSQNELLKQYYDANKLLVECLNSDCYVSREVRQEIEDTLLLPMRKIYMYFS